MPQDAPTMKKLLVVPAALALAALVSLAAPARTDASVDASISLRFALPVAPPLVVVEPGVQVVEDWEEEVFFVSGFYWTRRDGRWYRAAEPRARFVYVPARAVPVALVKVPPGHYVKYRKAKHRHGDDHGRRHDHDDHGHGRGHDDHGRGRGHDDRGRGHDDHGRGRGHDDHGHGGKHRGGHKH
jgi:hypothetical protein